MTCFSVVVGDKVSSLGIDVSLVIASGSFFVVTILLLVVGLSILVTGIDTSIIGVEISLSNVVNTVSAGSATDVVDSSTVVFSLVVGSGEIVVVSVIKTDASYSVSCGRRVLSVVPNEEIDV